MFLISFLLHVTKHCAPIVSIATSNGGPHFEGRWKGFVVVVSVGGLEDGVKVQGRVLAVIK